MQPLLKVEGLYKSFGPTHALVNVDMEVKGGEIHGLIGENGSGKSTLSSIVAAIYQSDSGSMMLSGEPYAPRTIVETAKYGVSMVTQEQGTISGMSVAQNLFVGKEHLFTKLGVLNIRRMYKESAKVLEVVNAGYIKPSESIDKLSFEDRKLVEIARAMYTAPKLLIIDETTTALTIKGRQILYSIMRRQRDQGGAVIFISHDIEEVIEMCDSLTILRDGNVTAHLNRQEMEPGNIKQLMIGREIADNFYRSDMECTHLPEVALQGESIEYGIIKGISFKLHRGEILGIGGLTDCGMHDLGKILFGLLRPEKGAVLTKNDITIQNPDIAIHNNIGYISKNRDKESLMVTGSILENLCLPSLDKLRKCGLILPRTERRFVEQWVEALQIKMRSIDQKCSDLSGGNKQKVVLSKWLGKEADILILDCPTRGIDIGVKAAVYKLMVELKAKGIAIVMISEELPELIGMSDRVIILKGGVVTKEFRRDEHMSESEVIKYMV